MQCAKLFRNPGIIFDLREVENINIPELRHNFWLYSRHVNRRITGYVTVDATKKTTKKASKFGILIFGSSLIYMLPNNASINV